ncbi:MAG: hypothetical protein ACTSRF_04045 [Candidatus Freyarchaeota archaeon]
MSTSDAIIPLVTQALNDIYSKIENVTSLIEKYTNKIQKFTDFFSENITNMIQKVVELTNTVRSERTKTIQHLNESTTNILNELRKLQEINVEQMREETVKAHKSTLGSVQDAMRSDADCSKQVPRRGAIPSERNRSSDTRTATAAVRGGRARDQVVAQKFKNHR